MKMLNQNSPIPLYRQLADILLSQITGGEYEPGTKIEPELNLAEQYKIGRPTVRQAIDHLVRKNILYRKRGSGTFVKAPEEEIDLFSLAGTSTAFSKQNENVDIHLLEAVSENKIKSDKDNPFSGQTALSFSRLTMTQKQPVLLEYFYLNHQAFKGLDQMDIEGRSLSAIVAEKFYLEPEACKQNFIVDYPNPDQANLLKISKDKPILKVQRFLHFPNLQNGIYAILVCRTDQFVFSQTIRGNNQ